MHNRSVKCDFGGIAVGNWTCDHSLHSMLKLVFLGGHSYGREIALSFDRWLVGCCRHLDVTVDSETPQLDSDAAVATARLFSCVDLCCSNWFTNLAMAQQSCIF